MESERDRLLAGAANAQRLGQFDEAQRAARAALDLDADSVSAMFLLGVAHARKGEPLQAIEMLTQVLKAEPKAYEVLVSLSNVYREIGNWDEAIKAGKRAVELKPNDASAHNNLGRCLLAARHLEPAATAFARAASLQPTFSAAYYNLGKTRQLEGKDGEAARAFAKAAALTPSAENLLALGHMLLTLCDYEGALECGQRCVAQFPLSPAAHLLLCGALTETNAFEEAELHLRQAIELDPEHREALHMAARQRPLGFIAEANANLRRAIGQNPRQISAYDALMQNQKVTEDDRDLVEKMRELLRQGELSQTELVSIHYGLGKALEDLKEYADSMAHYDEANRITRHLKFGDVPFDRDRYRAHVDQMIDEFVPSRLNPGTGDPSDLPLLIIGVMRSGTSLTEQILSNHPQVGGAGEQLFWSLNWSRALPVEDRLGDRGILASLGTEYVALLRKLGRGATKVTDKMPGNYMFAGLIHSALPNARIIHVRRNPVDTCLSIWATPNHTPQDGSNDKGNIVFIYQQYMRLMEFWRGVLPSDRFLEIDYENLVTNPELTIRSILSFCGLPWDELCLRPHENKRLVATPSAWQVRQPFYSTSVARWKRFEPWLGEFRELLEVSHPGSSALPAQK